MSSDLSIQLVTKECEKGEESTKVNNFLFIEKKNGEQTFVILIIRIQ